MLIFGHLCTSWFTLTQYIFIEYTSLWGRDAIELVPKRISNSVGNAVLQYIIKHTIHLLSVWYRYLKLISYLFHTIQIYVVYGVLTLNFNPQDIKAPKAGVYHSTPQRQKRSEADDTIVHLRNKKVKNLSTEQKQKLKIAIKEIVEKSPSLKIFETSRGQTTVRPLLNNLEAEMLRAVTRSQLKSLLEDVLSALWGSLLLMFQMLFLMIVNCFGSNL